MDTHDGKKVGNRYERPRLTVVAGGKAGTPRTHAELELERAIRALFVAMCGKDGKSVNKNFRNVARGATRPARMLARRLREAKAARNDAHNYPLAKQTVREIDEYVDRLFNMKLNGTTGDHPKAA